MYIPYSNIKKCILKIVSLRHYAHITQPFPWDLCELTLWQFNSLSFYLTLLWHLRFSGPLCLSVRGLAGVRTQRRPAVWINLGWFGYPSSKKLQRLKATLIPSIATLSFQYGFVLGLVQVAGFNSKREHRTTVEKHRIHFSCARTLSKPSNKDILMSLLGWDVYFDFGEIKLSVCANGNSYVQRPNGSLMCFVGCHPCLFSSHHRLLHPHYKGLAC